ncbi:sporulation histidine kinase inhibitor Sda [Alkalihalobacterium alkalinitrilicum]|nr:sporulation histidine kinase inhibitor Sda [Alkalihalobacterium alkalinitrilicum]
MLRKLSDLQLLEAYKKAKDLNLSKDFINILKHEVDKRQI